MANKNQHIIGSRSAILILGMHRSGTSAMTRVLNFLGAELGRDLLPSKEDNAAGFWENQAVVQANEYLLKALGLTWHDPVALPPRWKQQAAIGHFGDTVRQLLGEQFGMAPLIALKDPRLSRFGPVWAESLAAEGVLPKIVVVVRHPAEVMRSLKKRDGFSAPKSQLLWLIHTIESMAAAEGFRHVYVHYESVLADWRTEVARVTAALDIAWPRDAESVASQIDAFIDPALRHYNVIAGAPGNAAPSVSPAISGKIARVYKACAAMAEDAPGAKAAIRDLLREVKPWLDVFGGPAREIALQTRQLSDGLRLQSAAHAAAETDSKAEIASLRASVRALELEREAARANIDDLAAQVLAAKEAHDARDRAEAELRASLNSCMDELARSQANTSSLIEEVRTASVTIDGLVFEIGVARENAKDLEAQVARAHVAHDEHDKVERELREALQQRDTEISAAKSNIDSLVGEINAARGNIGDLQAQIAVARIAHDEHDKFERELREVLRQKDAEIAQQRADIVSFQQEIGVAGNHIDSLVAELNNARLIHDDLSGQVHRARSAHMERDGTEADLRNQLASSGKELSLERVGAASLAAELEVVRGRVSDLVEEIGRSREAYAERLAEIDAARNTIRGLVSEIQVARDAHEIQGAREAELHGLLSQRDIEVAEIGAALAGIAAQLTEAIRRGDHHEAVLKRIKSARWSRFGRVLGLLRGE